MLASPSPQRRLTALALIAAAALGATACGSSSSSSSGSPQPNARPTPLISIFEAPVQLANAPGPTLDLLRHLGVQYVRVFVDWGAIAPDASSTRRPAGFDAASPAAYPAAGWAPYDAIVRAARARGIGVLLNLSGPAPLWATGPGAPHGGVPGDWKPSAASYGAFVHAVGTRYSGRYTPPGGSSPLPRVSFWSIWNEPNLGIDLAPEAIDGSRVESSPVMYRALADEAWSALHQTGHGADTILIGEIAPYGQTAGNNVPGNFGYMVPLRFVRALYCVDSALHPLQGAAAAARGCPATAAGSKRFAARHPVLFRAAGFAVHPYPSGSVAPNVALADGPGFVNLATLPRLAQTLDSVTATYGSGKRFPFYSTEYGYLTNPPYQAGAPLALAAADLNWAEYISWRNPRIRSWDQYLLVDPPADSPSKFVTGLEFADGTPKPTFAAYRMPVYLPVTHASADQALEVWGCVRPAHEAEVQTGRPQSVRIELQPHAGGAFKTVQQVSITDRGGYFDANVNFPSGGTVRLAWSYPHGPTVYSRSVSITIA